MTEPVAQLIDYATAHVPRYRRLGIRDIRQVPPSTKADIMREMPDYISDEFGEARQRLFSLVRNGDPTCEVSNSQLRPLPGVVMEQTSGTTGIQGRFPKTNAERTKLAMNIWRHRRRLDRAVSTDVFLSFVHLPFGRTRDRRVERESDPAVIRTLYDEAVGRGIRWLHSQPRVVCRHIRLFNEAGFGRLPGFLRFCETTGERMSDLERRTIAEYFGCGVVNQYGCIETWAIGYDRDGRGEFEILDDNVHVELLRHGTLEPVEGPGEVGVVAVTSLHLRLMPIIRYLNGDRAEWVAAGGGRRLRLHEDRQSNMLLMNGELVPGAGAMRVWLNMVYSNLGYTPLEFIQFVQTSELGITVRIGACPRARAVFDEFKSVVSKTGFSRKPFELTYEEVTAETLASEMHLKKPLFIARLASP
jgi:phenylacetate-CoA ligase